MKSWISSAPDPQRPPSAKDQLAAHRTAEGFRTFELMEDGSGAQTNNHQKAQRSTGSMEVQQSSVHLTKKKDQVNKEAAMPQPGKVLHLYVEVRSVSEEEEKFLGRGDDGTNQLMLQCPDIVSNSQRSSSKSSPNWSPDLSPVIPRRSAYGNQSLPSLKSSSRHSVSFQLQNPHSSLSPGQFQHQDALNDSFDHLLEVLAPNKSSTSHDGSLGCPHPPDMDPYYEQVATSQSSSSSCWLTVPSTYNSNPRSCEDPDMVADNGQMSLVSFGYIDKGSVNSMAGQGNAIYQHDPDSYLRRMEKQQLPACLQKRSDPVRCSDKTSPDNTLHSHPHQSRSDTSWSMPYLSKAAMDAVARDATNRALEEFGSPELRRRFGDHTSENYSPSLPRHSQAPRCRSWGGSPVLPRSILTLPSRTDLLEMDRRFCHGSVNGLPRSPASDHLCGQTGDSFYSVAPSSTSRPHSPAQSPQRPWVHEEGHRLSNKFHPPLPAGRPTDIQHEIPRSSNPSRTEHQAGYSHHGVNNRCNNKVTNSSHLGSEPVSLSSNDYPNSRSPHHPSRCSSRASDAYSPISDRRSISPFSITDLDYKTLGESNRISAASADRRYKWTPSPTPSEAESVRSESPQYTGTLPKESLLWQLPPEPTKIENQNHNRKTETLAPQTKPGCISPVMFKRGPSTPASPALPSKLDRVSASGSPVLDPQLRRTSSSSKDMSSSQPAHYTGRHKSPVMEQRQYDHLFDGSPTARRNASSQNAECSLVSWTSKQQKHSGPVVDRAETIHQSSSRVHTQSNDQGCRKDARGVQKQLAQECQLLVLGMSKTQKEAWDHSGATGTSSSSSSGVTGSLGDSLQLDRLSPDTSSQSSHGTADGGSGIQVGWAGRAARLRSSRSLSTPYRTGWVPMDPQAAGVLAGSSASSLQSLLSFITFSLHDLENLILLVPWPISEQQSHSDPIRPAQDQCFTIMVGTFQGPGRRVVTVVLSDRGSPSTPSSRSQKIARAKWEFLFGGQTDHRSKDVSSTTPPTSSSPSPTPPSSLHLQPSNQRRGWDHQNQNLSHHEVQQVEVEVVPPHLRGPVPKTGIIRRSIKYSETDLDAVPLRCYRETDLDEVMRAEAEAAEEADSAFTRNHRVLGKSCFSPEDISPRSSTGGQREENGQEEEDEEEEDEEEEGVVSWASVRMQGDRQRQRAAKEEEEVFSLLLKGTLEPSSDAQGGLKSPISVGSPRRPSESNLDSFSRHFESIMESHRAKGTSYSSLDSVDLLTSGSTSVFTFDLPTLTPEIQSQICESAKQILELSFAPLARMDSSACSETSRSEMALSISAAGLRGGSKDDSGPPVRSRSEKESWRRSIVKEGFRKATSVPVLHSRERPVNQPTELLHPQADVAKHMPLGGSDEVLTNGLKPDLQAAKRLAKRLYNLDGFRKSDVARHLSKNNDFSQMVVHEYLGYFNFSGMNIDQALRTFLTQFALMGETQERERVLAHFSRRYRQCNPESLSTEETVHTLTCAVMLLNTDLHGNNVGKRMSCSQFISNLEGLNDGKDFPKDLLKTLYTSIKNEKLQWTIDEEELRKSMSEPGRVPQKDPRAPHPMRRGREMAPGKTPWFGGGQQAIWGLYKGRLSGPEGPR
ncbi:hypothetical protein CRENBAI_007247 [Crenichthys baileyi]|uniref:SEC7 domain-containing protein n=1 Tax=Crenichthys baileyi TaxID=28760 RepID=A0AAV9S7V2_9TELE